MIIAICSKQLDRTHEPVRPTVVSLDPDVSPCPGAKLIEREVVRDSRTAWIEEWRVTVFSVTELLEIQRGVGAPRRHRRGAAHRHGEGGVGPL